MKGESGRGREVGREGGRKQGRREGKGRERKRREGRREGEKEGHFFCVFHFNIKKYFLCYSLTKGTRPFNNLYQLQFGVIQITYLKILRNVK